MAKLKKSANSSTSKPSGKASKSTPNAESLRASRSISESAQQIWLAGMGAFNRAQAEGGRLFESLVRDGLSLEQTARRFAGNRANVMKGAMEGRVDPKVLDDYYDAFKMTYKGETHGLVYSTAFNGVLWSGTGPVDGALFSAA